MSPFHEGTFLTKDRSMPLAPAPVNPESRFVYLTPHGKRFAWVTKTEEKGSDVNLATYLLLDAVDHDCDMAVVISNDSDLCEPIAVVRRRYMTVGVVCPHRKPSRSLGAVASWQSTLFRSHIRQCQFPATMVDGSGTFHKPAGW